MWYLLQCAIIFAVAASNIRWHWTPNGYLVGLVGVGLAYGLTLQQCYPAHIREVGQTERKDLHDFESFKCYSGSCLAGSARISSATSSSATPAHG